MQALEEKVQQEINQLQELEAIRKGIQKAQERKILKKDKTVRNQLSPNQNSLLDEIARIRQQQEEKTIEEPTVERIRDMVKEDEPDKNIEETEIGVNPFGGRIKFNAPKLITDDAIN